MDISLASLEAKNEAFRPPGSDGVVCALELLGRCLLLLSEGARASGWPPLSACVEGVTTPFKADDQIGLLCFVGSFHVCRHGCLRV